MSNNFRNIIPERPEPVVLQTDPDTVNKKSDVKQVVKKLLSGNPVLIEDEYPTGLSVLAGLKKKVFGDKLKSGKNRKSEKNREDDFKTYKKKRADFRYASNNLLVLVENDLIALRKSPEIGWLKILYPDLEKFLLPFPQIQGLNSSWQWYNRGIQYPVLKKKLFPWYGTYFPTRFDHLKLFNKWLKNYPGGKNTALDIGTGCGVLAFQLLQHGFEHVMATDISPNAVISVMENAKLRGVEDHLEVRRSDLFEGCDRKADVIVFNPPWLPAGSDVTGLDRAIYYEPELFERFFKDAGDFLSKKGRIVLFFSNLGRTEGMQKEHPIEEELALKRRYRKRRLLKSGVAGSSRKTRRRNHRTDEQVELWELEKVDSG